MKCRQTQDNKHNNRYMTLSNVDIVLHNTHYKFIVIRKARELCEALNTVGVSSELHLGPSQSVTPELRAEVGGEWGQLSHCLRCPIAGLPRVESSIV